MDQETERLIEAVKKILKAYGYFVDNLWHVSDIHFICEQQELPRLSDEEAMQVFAIVHEQFDGEAGISWPQLEKALRIYLQRKQLLSVCEGAAGE